MSDTETNKPRKARKAAAAFADDWPDASPAEPSAAEGAAPERQRVARAMARAGLCSRRDAEAWILEGRVTVNGERLTSPARDVGPDDAVEVDGAPLPEAEKTRLFLFHKPRGLVTSDHDPEGRETVTDYLRANWPKGPRVVTIGRLDINTEGLLLLTNDGGLARQLELPKTGWLRRYRVRANGETDQAQLDALAAGITIEGVDYAGIEAKLDRVQGANCWLTMGLREGKNREIKRVLEHLGLEVNRLIRLSFGPFQLLDLEEGAVEEVRTRVLKDQLGVALAAEAGVDFGDAPVPEPTPAPAKRSGDKAKRDKTNRDEAKAPATTITPVPRQRRDAPARAPERDGERSLRRKPTTYTPKGETRDERQPERPRRHVSTLRSARAEDVASGPRKRIERSATQDRNERVVTVERKVAARPARSMSPSAEGKRARIARSGGGRASDERDTRRDGFRSRDAGPRARAGNDRRGERSNDGEALRERPARTAGEDRPQRSFGAGKPRGRDGGRSETSGFDATRPARPSFSKPRGRGDAADGGAAKPGRPYSGKPRGAARGTEAAGSGAARPKRPFSGKAREGRSAEGAERGLDKRSGGASRPLGGRTFGKDDARGGARATGRPTGGKLSGGKFSGGKVSGSKFSGSKPGGRPRGGGGSGGAPGRGKR